MVKAQYTISSFILRLKSELIPGRKKIEKYNNSIPFSGLIKMKNIIIAAMNGTNKKYPYLKNKHADNTTMLNTSKFRFTLLP